MPTEPFIPYRDRPALDKGEIITWRDLESGMLFEPGVSTPTRRRVRGTPSPFAANRSYLIGSEDLDGTPKGGIEGTDQDCYRRFYDDDNRPVYLIAYDLQADDLHTEGPNDDEWINRAYQSGPCGNERRSH
jgi:hypothetical protein